MEIIQIIVIILLNLSILYCLTSFNMIYSLFWLILSFINGIIILYTLNINIIATILLIIYIGAIAILFIFSIMFINFLKINKHYKYVKYIYFYLFFIILINILYNKIFVFDYLNNYSILNINFLFRINKIGIFLYYLSSVYIIICSLLLLLPMIGILNYK